MESMSLSLSTCSPILDFKSLYSLLSDQYQIAVVEKFGYGFSDVVDKDRDIDSILEDTRSALAAVGLNAPYVQPSEINNSIGSCGTPMLFTFSAFSFTRSISLIIVTVAVRL